MATYAVSDIHGCYDEFISVLDKCAFGDEDELYILGDAIDRGPASEKMVKWLVENKANAEGSHVHYLMGNHEQMMMWSMDGNWGSLTVDIDTVGPWRSNGGAETLSQLSAALTSGALAPEELDEYQQIVERAPKVASLHTQEHGLVILCHAGIRPPDDPLDVDGWLCQSEEDLLWLGGIWYRSAAEPPFHVVSGHIPTDVLAQWKLPGCPQEVYIDGMLNLVMNWGKKHAIDCGSCFGGRVGALRIEDWETYCQLVGE